MDMATRKTTTRLSDEPGLSSADLRGKPSIAKVYRETSCGLLRGGKLQRSENRDQRSVNSRSSLRSDGQVLGNGSVPGSRFTIHGSRFTVHGPRPFSVHGRDGARGRGQWTFP